MNDPGRLHDRVGWHPDPTGRYEYRWFNGYTWTADVAAGGVQQVDPQGVAAPPSRRGRGLAVASLMVGLSSLVFSALPVAFVGGALGALVAIGLAIAGLRRARRSAAATHDAPTGRGLATAGLILGIVALPTCALGWYFTTVLVDRVQEFTDLGEYEVTVDQCDVGEYMVVMRGSITNLDDRSHAYSIDVRFTLSNGDNAVVQLGSTTSETASVKPGATARFSSATFDVPASAEPGDIDCEIASVNPSFGFGFEGSNGGGIGT